LFLKEDRWETAPRENTKVKGDQKKKRQKVTGGNLVSRGCGLKTSMRLSKRQACGPKENRAKELEKKELFGRRQVT